MGVMGYRKRTSFMAGLTVAQISEFSLILMAMGLSLGHLDSTHVALVVLVGVVTMTISTYLILGSDKLYSVLQNYLDIFEKKKPKELAYLIPTKLKEHIVLVGGDRTGSSLAKFLLRKNVSFVVVDFNPKVYTRMTADNLNVVFGDINDPEIIEAANVTKANYIISTISNLSDNLVLLEFIKGLAKKPKTILTAATRSDAVKLYESGANYVVVPEIVAGDHITHLLDIYGYQGKRLTKAGKSHFNRLIFK